MLHLNLVIPTDGLRELKYLTKKELCMSVYKIKAAYNHFVFNLVTNSILLRLIHFI